MSVAEYMGTLKIFMHFSVAFMFMDEGVWELEVELELEILSKIYNLGKCITCTNKSFTIIFVIL